MSRTLLLSGKEKIIKNKNLDTDKFHTFCWGDYSHKDLGKFDAATLEQKYLVISTKHPFKQLSKGEIINEFLKQ